MVRNNMISQALYTPLPFRAKRIASWNREGYNKDWIIVSPSCSSILADIDGPGIIAHIWFAVDNDHKVEDPLFLRKNTLEIYWDGSPFPSVRVPLGDFFGIGHGKVRSYASALFDMSINTGAQRGGFNCWVQMPFHKQATFILRNESEVKTRIFYYIDYQEHELVTPEAYYFHASWRAEMPCRPTPLLDGKEAANLTGENNYRILETSGEGNYLGCNLSVDNFNGGWWGEGDDMLFVDHEPFPGSLHGTGTEDYFNHAWGMQDNCFPYAGTSLFNHMHSNWSGQWTMYRFHMLDPIPFKKHFLATIEHGHNNHRSDDYSSTAYWYQRPIVEALVLPKLPKRLPRSHHQGANVATSVEPNPDM